MTRGGDSDKGTHHHHHSTPNHCHEQLLTGWKGGAPGGDNNKGEGTTMRGRGAHSDTNRCHEQLLMGWIAGANSVNDHEDDNKEDDNKEDDNEEDDHNPAPQCDHTPPLARTRAGI